MDKATVGYSLNKLIDKGILIRKGRGAYRLTDNLFGQWLNIATNEKYPHYFNKGQQ